MKPHPETKRLIVRVMVRASVMVRVKVLEKAEARNGFSLLVDLFVVPDTEFR